MPDQRVVALPPDQQRYTAGSFAGDYFGGIGFGGGFDGGMQEALEDVSPKVREIAQAMQGLNDDEKAELNALMAGVDQGEE